MSTPLSGSSSLRRALRCSEALTTIRQSTRREIPKSYIFINAAARNSKSRSAKEYLNSYSLKFCFTNDYYSYFSPSIFVSLKTVDFNPCSGSDELQFFLNICLPTSTIRIYITSVATYQILLR